MLLGGLLLLMVGSAYALHVLVEKPLSKILRAYLTKRLLPLA